MLAGLSAVAQTSDTPETSISTETLKKLSLEQLMDQDVTMVSRRPEKWFTTPSAEQVITGEDISRSGATRIPEALRLAPNLQVAQIDSANWAISSRGFNRGTSLGSGTAFNLGTADKLLVMMDGRTLYTPLFAGVFWNHQDTMLADIDRIEVVSGPGGSLWGANAMNGVINIISKSAKDTQGGIVSAGGGSQLQDFVTARYGGILTTDVYYRVYGKYFDEDSTSFANGQSADNAWRMGRTGFRLDWLPPSGDTITFEGDAFFDSIDQPRQDNATANGQDFIGRWTHVLGEDTDFTLQTYWDRIDQKVPGAGAEQLNTFDVDFQHRLPVLARNRVIWGVGYRVAEDHVPDYPVLSFNPSNRNLQFFSVFAQDEVALVPERLGLTFGSRFEHNDYSGWEVQPTVRLAWTPNEWQTVWGAVSGAVRSPSRIDRDVVLNVPPITLVGSDNAVSEKLVAYELGYRIRPVSRVVLSVATFYNQYDDLHSIEPSTISPTTFAFGSGLTADSWGVELSGTYEPMDHWRLRGGYTYFDKDIGSESRDITQGTAEGNDPAHQFLVQSIMDLPYRLQLDTVARYVAHLPSPHVPSYFAMDIRLAWRARRNLELAIVGQNLWEPEHAEFGAAPTRQEIPRSVYGKLTWSF